MYKCWNCVVNIARLTNKIRILEPKCRDTQWQHRHSVQLTTVDIKDGNMSETINNRRVYWVIVNITMTPHVSSLLSRFGRRRGDRCDCTGRPRLISLEGDWKYRHRLRTSSPGGFHVDASRSTLAVPSGMYISTVINNFACFINLVENHHYWSVS